MHELEFSCLLKYFVVKPCEGVEEGRRVGLGSEGRGVELGRRREVELGRRRRVELGWRGGGGEI